MLIHERSTHWLTPQWNVPASVHGVVSTTAGHLSRGAYRGFNTADHVGADPHEVKLCRQFFQQKFATRNNPQWLDQVHGTAVVTADGKGKLLTGDACYTDQSDLVC
ncbi:MAG: laccase domain-containing protein, partial [Pseudomonadales bacterium]|nr:laccase domain-containing protein [Pseudomonadales bacterium]